MFIFRGAGVENPRKQANRLQCIHRIRTFDKEPVAPNATDIRADIAPGGPSTKETFTLGNAQEPLTINEQILSLMVSGCFSG